MKSVWPDTPIIIVTYVNLAVAFLKCKDSGIIGRSPYEFVSPEDIDSVRMDIRKTFTERKASVRERDKGEFFSTLTMSSRNRLWSRFSLTR